MAQPMWLPLREVGASAILTGFSMCAAICPVPDILDTSLREEYLTRKVSERDDSQERQTYTPEFKAKVVLESMQRDTTIEEVRRKYGVSGVPPHSTHRRFGHPSDCTSQDSAGAIGRAIWVGKQSLQHGRIAQGTARRILGCISNPFRW